MNKKIKRITVITAKVAAILFLMSILWVLLMSFINPPVTYLMLQRKWEARGTDNNSIRFSWRNLNEISPNLDFAVVAAEDQKFYQHNGFDYEEIKKAMEQNERRKRKRGASTISQQVAKNVFLWQGRNWIRKGFEVYFTVLIEFFWSKDRIMEMYLNVAEMGDMVFGAEAAAQYHFKKPASKLTAGEAALIAATLPNPRKFSASRPSGYINKRKNWILQQMRQMGSLSAVKEAGK